MKLQISAIAAALALGVGASANAATISSLLIANPSFSWEDDNVERLVVDKNGNGLLDVGDTLRGIVEFPLMKNGATSIPLNGTTNSHLSAIFEVEVKSKIGLGPLFNFEFGAVGGPLGTVVTFYEDAVDNLNIVSCGATQAICEGTVTDGTKILELGFAGDVDEYWAATASPDNPNLSTLESMTTNSVLGSFNYGLSVTFNGLGLNFGEAMANAPFQEPGAADGNDLVQFVGSGTIGGICNENPVADANVICNQREGSFSAGYTSTSDAQVGGRVLPEPGSLALIGVGLLAVGAGRFRRKM